MTETRHDWTKEEIEEIYSQPLMDLVFEAARVHRTHHETNKVQLCRLISVKTGGCPEDCSYCGQSARHKATKALPMLTYDQVMDLAKRAKSDGCSRFCMGAGWREVRDNTFFENVLKMIEGVNDLGMEVCCTLGMLTPEQAKRLKEAGLYAYNHNLDTSREYYPKIITTRTYDERLETLQNVRDAGLTVCCGGIVGLGEEREDRIGLLHTLATMAKHPESVPINKLAPTPGTPLENQPPIPTLEIVRTIATARLTMPKSMIRMTAGRNTLNDAEQALVFLAGANSIFMGQKQLFLTQNPGKSADDQLLDKLGLEGLEASSREQTEPPTCDRLSQPKACALSTAP